jgi:hypothetical protein
MFDKLQEIEVAQLMREEYLVILVWIDDVIDVEHGIVRARAYKPLGKSVLKSFIEVRISKLGLWRFQKMKD